MAPEYLNTLLQAIIDGEDLQRMPLGLDGDQQWPERWIDINYSDALRMLGAGRTDLRVKPRTISINGFDVPEPLRTAPAYGSEYFSPSLSDSTYRCTWANSTFDDRVLERGLVHTTREAAELHAKALLSLTKDATS